MGCRSDCRVFLFLLTTILASYSTALIRRTISFRTMASTSTSFGRTRSSWKTTANHVWCRRRCCCCHYRRRSSSSVSSITTRHVARRWRRRNDPQQQQRYRSSVKRGRRRFRSDCSSDTSRGKPHRRKRDNHTLLGKTGVSALHEWCDKRKLTPKFMLLPREHDEEFIMSVELHDKEQGRGRGGTKASAKQDAARQALQSLVPGGVVFDDNGILVELPSSTSEMEELAPNLASRLAIGESSKKRDKPSSRTWDVYPGTSTTSEEENDYYASRGASVCSALVHAMWQIHDDIPEPPSYTYDVCTKNPAAKRKGVAGSTAVVVHRASFVCTARLLVKTPLSKANDKEQDSKDNDSDHSKSEHDDDEDKFHVKTLTAVGTAVTKREARHAASAKLLAMLFPECNGMVEVKAAAEAARETVRCQQGSQDAVEASCHLSNDRRVTVNRQRDYPENETLTLLLLTHRTHRYRFILVERLRHSWASKLWRSFPGRDGDEVNVESLSLSEKVVSDPDFPESEESLSGKETTPSGIEESISRSLNRQKQLDERVDAALQMLNEVDDAGRSLPEELNSNDVGRTVLRRAEIEDAVWIKKAASRSP